MTYTLSFRKGNKREETKRPTQLVPDRVCHMPPLADCLTVPVKSAVVAFCRLHPPGVESVCPHPRLRGCEVPAPSALLESKPRKVNYSIKPYISGVSGTSCVDKRKSSRLTVNEIQ
jgi:hypothetical protein